MKKYYALAVAVMVFAAVSPNSWSQSVKEASAPQGVTVSIYDTGLAMINEARRVSITSGENDILIRSLPVHMDPSSASYGTVARSAPFELLEQYVRYDLKDNTTLFNRMAGQPIILQSGETSREGLLLSGPLRSVDQSPDGHLPVRSRDGKQLWLVGMDELSSVIFPFAKDDLATEPELTWKVRSRQEGPQNFRLAYRASDINWNATYEMVLDPAKPEADFNARVEINNQSGGRYENARVRLMLTEKGMAKPIIPDSSDFVVQSSLRYAYGSTEPGFERSVSSLAPIEVYELPRPITLESGSPTYVQLIQSSAMPVNKFYVYDGVRFDRFQRNRRTDWSFGTEYNSSVQAHVEFENVEKFGLGMNLPPGLCRLYQARADGAIDMIGEEMMLPMSKDGKGYLRVGPARGLSGERERTGYIEVKPHHVYEESFEIRLANSSDESVQIRVVEHLYRWSDYQVVRADAEYVETKPQMIEFLVDLKPGGRRSIHYTVRYNW